MNIKRILITSLFLIFSAQTMVFAQSANVSKMFKNHFHDTVELVHQTESPIAKRMLLNDSFSKMIKAIEKIESTASLTDDEVLQLASFKNGIIDRRDELNGSNGFDSIADEDLDEFSSFSQDFMEQADRTVTIGVTTILLILLILLLI